MVTCMRAVAALFIPVFAVLAVINRHHDRPGDIMATVVIAAFIGLTFLRTRGTQS